MGGLLDSVSRGSESVAYGYDGSLVMSESRSGTLDATLAYTYDNNFALTSFSYADGTMDFAYDDVRLLTQAGAFTITRNATNGLPTQVSDDAYTLTPAYNGYGEAASQTVNVNGAGVSVWNLSRDAAGRITGKTETVAGTTTQYAYAYDTMSRLTSVMKDSTLVEQYTYGLNGERLSDLSGKTYQYDIEDHMVQAGDTVYEYDVDGFLTTKTEHPGQPNQAVTHYQYSSRGELLRVILPDGRTVEYVNDALGRRVAKKVNGTVVEKYLWAGLTGLLAVYDGNGNLKYRFEGPKMMKDGATYYLVGDQVGTVKAVVDTTGTVVKRLTYDSFGNILPNGDSNPSFTIPITFAGGLCDSYTGLIHFGFRDYDPETGRWTAKDPIGFAGGNINLYGYCLSNPVSFADPVGLDYTVGSFLSAGLEFYVSVGSSLNAVFPIIPSALFLNESPISQARRFESTAPGLTTATEIAFYSGMAAGIAQGVLEAGAALGEALMARGTASALEAADIVNDAGNVGKVIRETIEGAGNFTSECPLTADELLDAGTEFLGKNYTELGEAGSGVFRSKGGLRGFRIDANSLAGAHDPYMPHGHLEIYDPMDLSHPVIVNHLPFTE